jgi:hypothetical protein
VPAPLAAQRGAPETPTIVRAGKWIALGAATAATVLGIRAHNTADRHLERLRDYCAFRGPCTLGPDGRYANPDAEAIYRDIVRGDRAARAYLASAQVALLGSVVLWVWDLRHRTRPANEPYGGPLLEQHRGSLRAGWRLPLPHVAPPAR